MRIRLHNFISLASHRTESFDLHAEYGLAAVREEAGAMLLVVNDTVWHSRPKPADMSIMDVKWRDRDHVILYLGGAVSVITSKQSWDVINLGWIDRIFISKSYIFVTYGEENVYSARKGDLESNALCVFSHEGEFLFGSTELFESTREDHWVADISSGYTYDEHMVFHSSEVDRLWDFDAHGKRLEKLPVAFSTICIHVLSGDDRQAYAIFDNRAILSLHPEWPVFELAIFDLQSKTASKQDFGSVENALIEACFDMGSIRFMSNSTGAIIVTDNAQAALLEISTAE